MNIQDWINDKFEEIASKLPTLEHTEPASFSCGFNVGYKQALLDLERYMEYGDLVHKSKVKEKCQHDSDGLKWKRYAINNEPRWKHCKKCEEFYR